MHVALQKKPRLQAWKPFSRDQRLGCVQGSEDKSVKWETLEHSGVLFPPEYTPHGVKMLYDGKPLDLNPQQEEVATSSTHPTQGQ